jgi:hypothetical protein
MLVRLDVGRPYMQRLVAQVIVSVDDVDATAEPRGMARGLGLQSGGWHYIPQRHKMIDSTRRVMVEISPQ